MGKLANTIKLIESHLPALGDTILAFSGGKDSIVMAHVMSHHFGIKKAICDNSFWFDSHAEDTRLLAEHLNLSITYKDRFGDEYLLKHSTWLFPPENKQGPIYGARQQKTVKKYALEHNYKTVVYGRRTEENTVPAAFYKTKDGLQQFHPIREWSETDIWNYINDNGLHIPRIYKHEIGQKDGSTPYNLICPEKYNRKPEELIKDFCPATYYRLIDKKIIYG